MTKPSARRPREIASSLVVAIFVACFTSCLSGCDSAKDNSISPDFGARQAAELSLDKPTTAELMSKEIVSGEPLAKDQSTTSDDDSDSAAAHLEKQLSEYKIPPDWLSSVTAEWDVATKPWKDGRIEIRRLLGTNDDASRREGIKLTWDYLQKDDIGNGHEYGMYIFLGNEPLWAIIAYRDFVNRPEHEYPPYFGLTALASLYADYGLFEEGEKLLERGVNTPPPSADWKEMREAEMHDAMGDLYVAWRRIDKAKASYEQAIRLYLLGKPPYGGHLLPRRVKKVQAKLDLLAMESLQGVVLRDGTYRETALGYSGDIKLTVKVSDSKIADIDVQHQEKIEQNASKIIPRRIIERQSLQVDGISGATVTKDAIVAGTLRALKQAGL